MNPNEILCLEVAVIERSQLQATRHRTVLHMCVV